MAPRQSAPTLSRPERALLKRFGRIRPRLMRWFSVHGRSYPWRDTDNWFHLLIAEMMLRRTRADQVLPVYQHFTRTYRTVRSAAGLSEEEVSELLHPLGLAWRGRHVYETIQYVREHYAKGPPDERADWSAIPGVGPYSEAMLRSRLFGGRKAAIDANVVRLLQRWMGLEIQPEGRRSKSLGYLADRFVGTPRSADLNLAMLDFAALRCRPRSPLCPDCPMVGLCKSAPV